MQTGDIRSVILGVAKRFT